MQSAGVAWDAVKAPAYLGDRALSRLGEGSGAVIRDGWSHHLYWLVRTGSAVGWDLLPVTVLGAATYVAVPPAGRTRSFGVHWALPPTADRRLTDAALLHDALAAAVAVSLDRHGAGVER
ncbi:hypothetical protein DVA86_28010 [Streptomyces armeniacus]|uniref:Uncharacterized protein n=1 Tax=Streptomyces armeniacus TaxID=83291 RepID=A0A345XW78_9ACTN|nr:hypothetical protein [Streptomyces armeniacus]AXK35894.1 hypothetical protein DVA86_28010 [Streptomyces armeniacus]